MPGAITTRAQHPGRGPRPRDATGDAAEIASPLFLFTGDLFGSGPALEVQYIVKDIVLVAAALVVAVKALGAKLVADE